jgi:hypothetical protein
MLKRILLCTTHHSAPKTTKSSTYAPLKKHSIDRAFLALAVVVLLLTIGAVAQQPDGTGAPGAICAHCQDPNGGVAYVHPGADGTGLYADWLSANDFAVPSMSITVEDWQNSLSSGPSWNLGMDAGPGLFGGISNRFMQFFRDEVIAWHQNYNSNQSVMNVTAIGEAWNPANQSLTNPRTVIGIVPFGPELPGAGEAPWSSTDVIFGLDPLGSRKLRIFQAEVGGGGGKRIVELWNPELEAVETTVNREIRIRAMGNAPGKIRFNLDGIEGLRDANGNYGPDAPIWDLNYSEARGGSFTAWELLGVKVWWRTGALSYDNVTFYLKGKPTARPW